MYSKKHFFNYSQFSNVFNKKNFFYKWPNPCSIFSAINESQKPLTLNFFIVFLKTFLQFLASSTFSIKSPDMTLAHTNKPLPAFNWLANPNAFGCCISYASCSLSSCASLSIVASRVHLVSKSNWGRQFLTCGGDSSSFNKAYWAALIDKPRIPSPHSFSALQNLKNTNHLYESFDQIYFTLCIQYICK